MSANWIVAAVTLLVLGIGGLILTTRPPSKGPVFIAENQSLTEDQVRQKLLANGWSNVQIVHDGKYFKATGTKSGQTSKVVVDAETGRLRAAGDYD